MNTLIEESEKYLIHSYNRYPVAMDHGEDVYLVGARRKKISSISAQESPYVRLATAMRNSKMH